MCKRSHNLTILIKKTAWTGSRPLRLRRPYRILRLSHIDYMDCQLKPMVSATDSPSNNVAWSIASAMQLRRSTHWKSEKEYQYTNFRALKKFPVRSLRENGGRRTQSKKRSLSFGSMIRRFWTNHQVTVRDFIGWKLEFKNTPGMSFVKKKALV